MKFKFRNLLIGTGIALLGVAAVGAAVGISEKKSDKPDTSDTMTENLDLINLIGDLQNQIDTVSDENEKLSNKANQLTNSLNNLQTENINLKNQLNTMFDTNINVNGNITANKGNFDSIQVGTTEFTESDLDKHLYMHHFKFYGTEKDTKKPFSADFEFISTEPTYYLISDQRYNYDLLRNLSHYDLYCDITFDTGYEDYINPTTFTSLNFNIESNSVVIELNKFESYNYDYESFDVFFNLDEFYINDYVYQII